MESTFEFFGTVDKNKQGKIGSVYPAWGMDVHLDELTESIERAKREIERGAVPPTEIAFARENLAKDKKRLDEIMGSKPKFEGKKLEDVAKEYKSLKSKIKLSLFTRSEMQMGTANPHEEARRMSEPCISVNAEIAKGCNVNVGVNSMVNRNDASKVFKILGKYLNEETNVETLRVDKRTK
jgi:hypothetical protein